MNKYPYEITLSATTKSEATEKMHALAVLARKLTARELNKLANVVENDPVKTMIAKRALGL
ncbi:MAG: hypothetical protein AAF597_14085 [Bacteroidota bacterium]